MNAGDRFFARVKPAEDGSGCLLWAGSLNRDEYGLFHDLGRDWLAHRWIVQRVYPIPPGMQIDHLCRNHSCVRPSHLEIVTQAENVRRGVAARRVSEKWASRTHCPNNHPLAGDNLYVYVDPKRGITSRRCKQCIADREAANPEAHREYHKLWARKYRGRKRVELVIEKFNALGIGTMTRSDAGSTTCFTIEGVAA
jgi:hypothetical protein